MTTTLDRPTLTTRAVINPWAPGAVEAKFLYDATSSLPLLDIEPADDEYADYLDLVYHPFGAGPVPRTGRPAAPWVPPTAAHSAECWVSYSGGKDSVAAALTARDMGYEPHLYYLAGLNRGQGNEGTWARRSADRLGMPIVVESVHISGPKNGIVEPPTKNQVSSDLLVARMTADGDCRRFTGGWHQTESIADNDPRFNWSDCSELTDAHARYLAARYPGLEHVWTCTTNELDCFARVAAEGLVGYVNGCLCSPRYLARVRAANERKYGRLLPGRCGSCGKCCWESIALDQLGVVPAHPGLVEHGMPFLRRDFAGHSYGKNDDDLLNALVPPDQVAVLRQQYPTWPSQTNPERTSV